MKDAVFLPFLLCFLLGGFLSAQVQLELDSMGGCNFEGIGALHGATYTFDGSLEAKETVEKILALVGMPPSFSVKAANVTNAQAVLYQGRRYILYSQNFMSGIYNQTNTRWSKIAVLAHEVGHHLHGHTLGIGPSRHQMELEAEEWSGFVLGKLGASLTDAQSAAETLALSEGSVSHPPKAARLEAIAFGFKRAQASSEGSHLAHKESMVSIRDQSYQVIRMNNLTWMVQNLNYQINESWCFDNYFFNCDKHGRLYTWEAANKACREVGWRLPTDQELKGLLIHLDSASKIATENKNLILSVEREVDSAGYLMQQSGFRYPNGKFFGLDFTGGYWISTQRDEENAWYYYPSHDGVAKLDYSNKVYGFSCRCVKN